MATSGAAVPERNVSIGRVFSRAFGTIGSNPVATLGIAFLFGALPNVLANSVVQQNRFDIVRALGPVGTIAAGIATVVIGIAFAMITQGALVRATVAHSEGRRAGIVESASAGLVVALPLVGLAILNALGVAAGMILLVVPGIILYIMWSVAAPALVEERLGPIEALGRSRELTAGARWTIFGLELVVLVCTWIVSAIFGVIMVMLYGSMQAMAAAAMTGFSIGYLAFGAAIQTVTSAFWGVVQTALYVELREWKDGPPADRLAEVFG
ncbi:MAG TPA: hypothetical protein VGD66_00635 [Allosphingosinicella sp.]